MEWLLSRLACRERENGKELKDGFLVCDIEREFSRGGAAETGAAETGASIADMIVAIPSSSSSIESGRCLKFLRMLLFAEIGPSDGGKSRLSV